MTPQGHQEKMVGPGHERKDIDAPALFMIVGLLAVLLFVSFVVSWGVWQVMQRGAVDPETVEIASKLPVAASPQPGLLVHPGEDWSQFKAAERKELDGYGWVDRAAGVAHIPVARAMGILAERGLPEVGAGQTRLQLMQGRAQVDTYPNEYNARPTPEATP